MSYSAIIQGGGARSIWCLGRLAALEDAYQEDPKVMTGISGGALVCLLTSCLGTRGAINHLMEIKSEDDFYKLVRPWQIFNSKGLLKPNGLQKWLHKKLDGRSMDIPFFVATYNLKSKNLAIISSEENSTKDMIEWVLASMTVPVVIDPVKPPYFDGWLKRSILWEPVIARADHMHILYSQPEKSDDLEFEKKKYFGIIGATIEAITWDNIEDDMENLKRHYDGAISVHQPKQFLLDYRDYSAKKMKAAFDDGYDSLIKRV